MMNQGEQEERVLELRRKVEELWRESSPMFEDEPDGPGMEGPDVEGKDEADGDEKGKDEEDSDED
jgi:hypothetical protein